jgi:ATP-dependent RNA helicase DeaD
LAFPPTSPPLARALAERDYNDPTPVQTAVLEAHAAGRDLLVSAQTGSGKTVAYGLALGTTLLGDSESLDTPGAPLALIIAPTRELALQVQRELEWLYANARARVIACVGGMDPRREARLLAEGAHIVVGTPGRLRDHLERGRFDTSALRAVVLDEADEMLDLGFREDLEFILDSTPTERRTLLFSATLPRPIIAMARQYQKDALRIAVEGGERGHADIEYRAVRVANGEIELSVVNVLRFVDAPAALVFCNTREAVRHLQAILSERGFSVVALSGELSQNERNHALQALRDGRARVCVATDVAARGIDLPHLGLVVHADLPHDSEVLQHRSGRTGRAGRKGVSVLLIPFSRKRKADRLMVEANVRPVWSGPPTAEEIGALDQERLLQHPALKEEKTEDDLAMARTLLGERTPEDVAVALVRLYRSQLPAAEDLIDPAERGAEQPMRPESLMDRSGDRRGGRPRDEGSADRPERSADNPGRQPPRSRLSGNSVWFRIGIGRDKNADPRWILPMICRQGDVTKQEIGTIRIFDRETRFEIAEDAAPAFIAAVRKTPKGEARIELVHDVASLPTDGAPAARPMPEQLPVHHELVLKGERAPEPLPMPREAPAHDARPVRPALQPFGKRKEEPPPVRHQLVLKGERPVPPPRREKAEEARPAKPARKPFGKRREEKPFEKKLFAMPQNRDKNKKKKWRADAGDRPLTRGSGKPSRPGKR